jgi:hypothetical protein
LPRNLGVALWRQIGGPAFLDLRQYLAVSPYAFIFAMVVGVGTRANLPIEIEFLGQVVSFLTCWTLFLVSSRVIFATRFNRPLHPAVVLGFALVVGALNYGSFELVALATGNGQNLAGARLLSSVNSILFGVVSVFGLAGYKVIAKKMISERDLLLAESLSFEVARRSGGYLDPVIQKLRSAINEQKDSSNLKSLQLATRVQEIVDADIRPASRKLWADQSNQTPAYSLRSLTRILLREKSFIPLIAVIPGLIPTLATAASTASLSETVILIAADAAILTTLYAAVNFAPIKSPRLAYGLYALLSLVAPYLVVTTNSILFEGLYQDLTVAIALLALWLLLVNFSFAFGVASLRPRSEILRRIKAFEDASSSTTSSTNMEKLVNREIANLLHSQMQNRLLSFTQEISNPDISKARLAELISNLEIDLVASLPSSANANLTIAESCEKLENSWRGILNVTFTGLEFTAGLTAQLITPVLEEAISNSVRHGKAEKVAVEFALEEDELFLFISDDGFGPRNGKSNLGSSLFSLVSKGNWTLTAIPTGGSRLKIELPRI